VFKERGLVNFPWRIFFRLLLIQGALIIGALVATGFAARFYFKEVFVAQVTEELRHTLVLLNNSEKIPLESQLGQWCAEKIKGTPLRLTVVRKNGEVACDSERDPESTENHSQQPEIKMAMELGFGSKIRYSNTVKKDLIYGALRLSDEGGVLRLALPLSAGLLALKTFDLSLSSFVLVLAISLALFAYWAARTLVFPFGRLLTLAKDIHIEAQPSKSLSATPPIDSQIYGDWSELELSIHSIKKDLEESNESLNLERQELSTLMASISDAVLAIDLESAPLFYNSRFALLFAQALRKQPPLHFDELLPSDAVKTAFQEALSLGKGSRVETSLIVSTGPRNYFSVSIAPLRQRSGKIYGALGIFHDVSDLKLAEQIRIDFVANVSHELRTPLTAIQGYTETLSVDTQNNQKLNLEFLSTISRNVERLIHLIDDLLDLSSLESHSSALQKELVDTEEISERIISQLRSKVELQNQKVELSIQAKSVSADPKRLEQVLVNLLDNANKFSPAGATISLRWEHDNDGSVLLVVADSGPGVAPEHHARLFERFYRIDKARSRQKGGTGLGLAIVKHIMQSHDGSVRVESVLGQGSKFICSFPA